MNNFLDPPCRSDSPVPAAELVEGRAAELVVTVDQLEANYLRMALRPSRTRAVGVAKAVPARVAAVAAGRVPDRMVAQVVMVGLVLLEAAAVAAASIWGPF